MKNSDTVYSLSILRQAFAFADRTPTRRNEIIFILTDIFNTQWSKKILNIA
jgi:hypothetical protein